MMLHEVESLRRDSTLRTPTVTGLRVCVQHSTCPSTFYRVRNYSEMALTRSVAHSWSLDFCK